MLGECFLRDEETRRLVIIRLSSPTCDTQNELTAVSILLSCPPKTPKIIN